MGWLRLGRPRAGALLLLVLGLTWNPGSASRAAPLELGAAWDGRFVPGRTTEIRLRVLSERGGPARVQLRSGPIELSVALQLEPRRALTRAIPIRPGNDGHIYAEAALPDGRSHQAELRLDAVRDQPGLMLASRSLQTPAGWIRTDPTALVSLPEGYGPIAALALAPADLALLSPDQVHALDAYLMGCGSLALPGIGASDLGHIRAGSGCGGRRVVSAVADLVVRPSPDSAESVADAIRSLPATRGGDTLVRVCAILAAYVLLLAVLAARTGTGYWLLAVPPVVALLLWQALPRLVASVETVTWAIAESGDPVARTATLIRIAGDGRGPAATTLAPMSRLPVPLDLGRHRISLDANGIRLHGPAALFAANTWIARGLTPVPVGLDLRADGDRLVVDNATGSVLRDAWIVAHRAAHPLPAIEAGESRLIPEVPAGEPHPPEDMPRPEVRSLVLRWPHGQAPEAVSGPAGDVWLVLLPEDRRE